MNIKDVARICKALGDNNRLQKFSESTWRQMCLKAFRREQKPNLR